MGPGRPRRREPGRPTPPRPRATHLSETMTIAPIYHDLAERDARDSVGMTGSVAGRYKLTPADFAAHLDAIDATGRRVGLLDAQPWPDVAFTFDDGGASALLAASMLEERGWRGHFYVTTD